MRVWVAICLLCGIEFGFALRFNAYATALGQEVAPIADQLVDSSLQVRIGKHAGYTRVVLDLPDTAEASVIALGPVLQVSISGATTTAGATFEDTPEMSGYLLQDMSETPELPMYNLYIMGKHSMTEGSGYRLEVVAVPELHKKRWVLDISAGLVNTQPINVSLPKLKRAYRVLLDPGHGGIDPGAQEWVTEKVITLEVANKVRMLLEQAGAKVTQTRTTDKHLSSNKNRDLADRARTANGKDLFVSIHVNAVPKASFNKGVGLEVFYWGPTRGVEYSTPAALVPTVQVASLPQLAPKSEADLPITDTSETAELGDPIPQTGPMQSAERRTKSRMLAKQVMSQLLAYTGAKDRGVRTANFYVIRYTTVPAVLVELGFATHPLEGPALANSNYQDRLAAGIAAGIIEHLNQRP